MALVESTSIEAAKRAWEIDSLAPVTQRFPERRERFTTSSDDMEVETVYAPATRAQTLAATQLHATWRSWAFPATIR